MMMYSTIVWPFLNFFIMLRRSFLWVVRTDQRFRARHVVPRRGQQPAHRGDHDQERAEGEHVLDHCLSVPQSRPHGA